MTTSGTVAQTQITVEKLITKSILRCGFPSSSITPEILDQARENLYYYIMSLGNDGPNLWTYEKTLLSFNPNQAFYNLPAGTIEILTGLYRITDRVSDSGHLVSSDGQDPAPLVNGDVDSVFVQNSTNGSLTLTTSQPVITLALMSYGDHSFHFVLEGSSDNFVTTKTVQDLGVQSFVDKQFTWFDITIPSDLSQFRIRETGGGTISLRQIIFGTYYSEFKLTRMNFDTYSALPNKQSTGTNPLQFWYNRLIPQPQIVVWPVASNYFGASITLWRTRQIQDVGEFTNTMEMPDRWAEA